MTRSGLIILAGALTAILVAGAVASPNVQMRNGDPHTVSGEQLQHELERKGISIRYAPSDGSQPSSLIGVASDEGSAIGFEFQFFPASDDATTRLVAHLGLKALGWQRPTVPFDLEARIRGVLGNVAYAQYEVVPVESHQTVKQHLRQEKKRRELSRRLDEALFDAFPADDPYAHPLLRHP